MADRRNYRKQYKSGNKTRLGHAIYGGGLDYSQLCTTVLAHYRRNRCFRKQHIRLQTDRRRNGIYWAIYYENRRYHSVWRYGR